MAIHSNEMQFFREQQRIIADSRAREQQRANNWAASQQRQRNERAWAESAASLKRRTELPSRLRTEPPPLVPGHAAALCQPEDKVSRPTLGPSSHVRDLLERTLAFVLTLVMWAFAALVAVPWLYTSTLNRALVTFAVSFGLAVNLAVLIVCGVQLLLLCRVGRSVAIWVAMCITAVAVLPFVLLDVLFGRFLRLLVRRKSS